MERIIVRNLNNYLESNTLLDNSQHGARYGRPTITNLLSCESTLAECVNANRPNDVILFDF